MATGSTDCPTKALFCQLESTDRGQGQLAPRRRPSGTLHLELEKEVSGCPQRPRSFEAFRGQGQQGEGGKDRGACSTPGSVPHSVRQWFPFAVSPDTHVAKMWSPICDSVGGGTFRRRGPVEGSWSSRMPCMGDPSPYLPPSICF